VTGPPPPAPGQAAPPGLIGDPLADLLARATLPRLRPGSAAPGLLAELAFWWERTGSPAPGGAGEPVPASVIVCGTHLPPGPQLLAGRLDIPVRIGELGRGGHEALLREALSAGVAHAAAAIAAGARILACIGPGPTDDPAALALLGAGRGLDALALLGLPNPADATGDGPWTVALVSTRELLRQVNAATAGWPTLLASGSPALAMACGVLLVSAERRVPVLCDGIVPAAAATWLSGLSRGLGGWWRVAGSMTGRATVHVHEALGTPALDLRQHWTDGYAALLAVEVLRAALAGRQGWTSIGG